jgi:hypothetical protein
MAFTSVIKFLTVILALEEDSLFLICLGLKADVHWILNILPGKPSTRLPDVNM